MAHINETGWRDFDGVVEWAAVGNKGWNDPSFALYSDDNRALIFALGGEFWTSYYLRGLRNWNSLIKNGQIISGIQVRVERRTNTQAGGNVYDYSIRLVKNSTTIIGNDKSTSELWGVESTDVDYWRTYGGTSDIWGLTQLDASEINSNFGMAFSCQVQYVSGSTGAYIDAMQMYLYYKPNPILTVF